MPTPGEHVRTAIREAVKYGLGTIVAGSTYHYTINKVGDPPMDIQNLGPLPAVNLFTGREGNAIDSGVQAGANNQLLHNSFVLSLDYFLYVPEKASMQLFCERALADVQRYFGTYYYIPDSNGVRTVFNCIYAGSEIFALSSATPNCGLQIDFMVYYRQKLTDPTTLA